MIKLAIDGWISDITWTSFQSMLADHNGAFFAWFDAFGQDEDAVGKYVGVHIEHHLVASKGIGLRDLPRPRIRWQGSRRNRAHHFLQKMVALHLSAGREGRRRRAVHLLPKITAGILRLPHQPLGIIINLPILTSQTRLVVRRRIHRIDRKHGGVGRRRRQPQSLAQRTNGLVVKHFIGSGRH